MRGSSSAALQTPSTTWRTFCLWYFSIRPTLILLLHSQLVLPTIWYPSILLRFHRWYVSWSGDPLLTIPPRWFQGIVIAMMVGQVPFEGWALKQVSEGKRKWQMWVPVYATHVLTCMVPVFADLLGGTHVKMNTIRTLLPKVADLVGILALLWLSYKQGIFASLIGTHAGPEVIITPAPTPSKLKSSSS